jgi:hypothetical protein
MKKQAVSARLDVILVFSLLITLAIGGCQTNPAVMKSESQPIESRYVALNPRAYLPEVKLTPLSPRNADLNGKVIYIINALPADTELEDFLAKTADYLVKRYPTVKVIYRNKPSASMTPDPELWDEMVKKGNAFIYGAAPTWGTTALGLTYAAGLEKRGLPGAVFVYDTLIENSETTCAQVGTPMRRVSVPYPPNKMTEDQAIQIMDRMISALTSPLREAELKTGTQVPPRPPRVAMTGTLAETEQYFYDKGWTDGLPIIPPTAEKVAEMLKGTSHSPDEVITKTMWPDKLEVTVEKVAINGVMAGCRPEYMPVLLATVQAFSQFDYDSMVRSSNSFSFMQVVNGPVRKKIGINSGTYALGPGNQANATIGRALRLFIINLGGGTPGVNIMGNQGNVSAYGFCFGENEEESPWESLAVQRGFKSNESTVTIFGGGWSHVGNYLLSSSMDDLAKAIAHFEWVNGVVVLISPPRARLLAKKGQSKVDVQNYVWSKAALTAKEFRSDPYYKQFIEPILKGKEMYGEKYVWPAEYLGLPDDAVIPVYPRKYVNVVVVGGEVNPQMQAWKMAYPSTVSIDVWR